eukprot:2066262-Rhodomonas_salina.2
MSGTDTLCGMGKRNVWSGHRLSSYAICGTGRSCRAMPYPILAYLPSSYVMSIPRPAIGLCGVRYLRTGYDRQYHPPTCVVLTKITVRCNVQY